MVIGAPCASLITDPGRSSAFTPAHSHRRRVSPVSRLSKSKKGLSPASLAPSPSSRSVAPVFQLDAGSGRRRGVAGSFPSLAFVLFVFGFFHPSSGRGPSICASRYVPSGMRRDRGAPGSS